MKVVVPLCSNAQIDCGASWAGVPQRPSTNLYWGAIYGAKRFLQRKNSGWETLEVTPGDGEVILERAVFRRYVDRTAWQSSLEAPVVETQRPDNAFDTGTEDTPSSASRSKLEQVVILEAVHGDRIDQAVLAFWESVQQPRAVSFTDHGVERTEALHVVGYAGHNRLMDGLRLPESPPAGPHASTFVLACYSENYFGEPLSRAGVNTWVTTRALMAPEGYVLDATLKALGDNSTPRQIRERVVFAYARWQRIEYRTASRIFAPVRAR